MKPTFFKSLLLLFLVISFGCATEKVTKHKKRKSRRARFVVGNSTDEKTAGKLRSIYFNFNSTELSKRARKKLARNVKLLKKYKKLKIQLEGHCDDQGDRWKNLDVGKERSLVVKNYLVSQGISPKRLSTISFGKEKPKSFLNDEKSRKLNRRVNFVIAYR